MLDVAGFVRSSLGVVQPNPLKVSVAFKRFDSGPSHKCNARVRFDSGDQVSRHRFSEAWSSHHEINMLGDAVKENCIGPQNLVPRPQNAASLVGLSHWTVRVWLQKERLKRFKTGRRTMWLRLTFHFCPLCSLGS